MADSDLKKKIFGHRQTAMLGVIGKDDYLSAILADGDRRARLTQIVAEVARDEAHSSGGLMSPKAIVTQVRSRWDELQHEGSQDPKTGRRI